MTGGMTSENKRHVFVNPHGQPGSTLPRRSSLKQMQTRDDPSISTIGGRETSEYGVPALETNSH